MNALPADSQHHSVGNSRSNGEFGEYDLTSFRAVAAGILPLGAGQYVEEVAANLARLLSGIERTYPGVRQERSLIEEVLLIDGVPLLNRDAPVDVLVLQDCDGAETKVRADMNFGDIRPVGSQGLKFYPTPALSPASIGATLASIIGELASESSKAGRDAIRDTEGRTLLLRDTALVIVANSAPRQDKNPGRQGAPFVFARLGFNVFYFGTNTHELSYVRDHVHGPLLELPITEESTYRSKRLGHRVTEWRNHNTKIFGNRIELDPADTPPPSTVLIADNFGNLKTSFRVKDEIIRSLDGCHRVFVAINGRTAVASVAGKLQDGVDGGLLFAMGSSIHDTTDLSNHQMDLYVKGVRHGDNAVLRFFPEFTGTAPDLAPVAGASIQFVPVHGRFGNLLADFIELRKSVPERFVARLIK